MDPDLTSVLHPDDRRQNYTYYGARLFWKNLPLFVRDGLRSKPTIILGTTGFGKTEMMLSLAYSDAIRKRPVIFIDGKCDAKTRDKLYFYNHLLAKRPFYALLPYQQGDRHTDSWNPLYSSVLPITTITEAFFNAYHDPGTTKGGASAGGETFYADMQRVVFSYLIRALHSSGYAYNTQDCRALLDRESLLRQIQGLLRPSGLTAYSDLLRARSEMGRDYGRNMIRFSNYLSTFNHWSLNSYNPTIEFDAAIHEGATVYVGLPISSEPVTMGAIGNITLNQLKALSAYAQSQNRERKVVSCFADEAASFVDTGLAEWICKVRSSGFLLTLGLQTIASLEGRRQGFATEIRANTPNVVIFNPNDRPTAEWFSGLSREEPERSYQASIHDGMEKFSGSVRLGTTPRIHPDAILALQRGQAYYKPPVLIDRPPLLATPFLPDPDPACVLAHHRRLYASPKRRVRGLNVSLNVDQAFRTGGETAL